MCFDGVMDVAKSGVWRVFTSTLRALAMLNRVRLAAIVPCSRVADLEELGGAVEIISVPVDPGHPIRNIAWHATALPRLVRRLGADVLHIPSHNLVISRWVCPTVLTVHDITEFRLSRHYDPLRTAYRRMVVPRNIRLADRIVTVSEWTRAEIVRTFGTAATRIAVAPNGVDTTFRPVPRAEAEAVVRETLGVTPPYVLYVGQIHMPNKNLVRLVQAFAAARQQWGDGAKLILAGRESTGGDTVRAAIREAGIGDSVSCLGYVPDPVLPALYSAARVFCYPSLQEGFGLPVLEAMSCGTPVVTSRGSALQEVANDAALLVEPQHVSELRNALTRAYLDDALRTRLRTAGLERARRYSWRATATILAEVYQDLHDSRSAPNRRTGP